MKENIGPPLMARKVRPSRVNSPAMTEPGSPGPASPYRVIVPTEERGKSAV